MRLIFTFALSLMLLAPPARALEEGVYTTETFNQTYIFPNISAFAPTPEGGLAWQLFTTTQEIPAYDDKGILKSLSAKMSDGLMAYNAQTVLMRGYMFPLDSTEQQKRFLFGPFPMTCPYHFHTPPVLVIEVSAKESIGFSFDTVVIEGTLELIDNAKKEPYYKITNALLKESTGVQNPPSATSSGHPLFHKRVGVP